jgi:hypothetical protein
MHEEKRDVSMANCEPICNYVRQAKPVTVSKLRWQMRPRPGWETGGAGSPSCITGISATPQIPVGAIAIFLRTFTNV